MLDGKQIKDASIPVAKLVGYAAPAAPSTANKDMTASVTSADNQEACATTVAATPALDGNIQVFVNGYRERLGDGVKTKSCYFSGDSGTTARAIAAVATGDKLYWVGSVAGYQLAVTDKLDFDYLV